jgi:tRNA(Ile)-lysidine synthase
VINLQNLLSNLLQGPKLKDMKVDIPQGKYIVAVSGGVDSMVLLDLLSRKSSVKLVAAHFNHGIREDSAYDMQLVKRTSKNYNTLCEVGYADLGKDSSEENARNHRYKFLESIRKKYSADKIITAHHQDDLIETAFINILRGSGHRGLVSMKINPQVLRPLTSVTKKEILKYAKEHNIKWREDSTNDDEKYLRNYIRKNISDKLTEKDERAIITNIDKIAEIIEEKDKIIANLSHKVTQNQQIMRNKYIDLPYEIRRELALYWLRKEGAKDFNRKNVESMDIALKTAKPGTKLPVKKGLWLYVYQNTAEFKSHT